MSDSEVSSVSLEHNPFPERNDKVHFAQSPGLDGGATRPTICEAESKVRKEGFSFSNLWSLFGITSSYLLLVLLLGIIFGIAATGLHESIHIISHFWKDTVWIAIQDHMPYWWFPCVHMSIGTVASGFVVGFIVWKYIPSCEGGGTAAVKVCMHVGAELPLNVAISRFCLTSLYIGGGNTLGSEAPTLHICSILSAAVYNLCVRLFGEHRFSKQNVEAMVIVGCSCGLSAAFNTPLGGILYALEEFCDDCSISPRLLSIWIALGSSTALATHRILKGNNQFFDVDLYHGLVTVEPWMLYSFLIALLCATASHAFMILTLYMRKLRYTYIHDSIAMGVASLIVTFIASLTYVISNAVGYPTYTWGVSPDGLTNIIVNKTSWEPVFYCIAKFFMCSIAAAFGGSGGLFTPTLLIGGSIGLSLSATLLKYDLVGESDATILVICGMTGFFAALLRLPLTSAIVSYEMTSRLSTRNNVFLPIVVSALLSYYFADLLSSSSLEHNMILQDGFDTEGETSINLNSPQVYSRRTSLAVSVGSLSTSDIASRKVAPIYRIPRRYTIAPVLTPGTDMLGINNRRASALRSYTGIKYTEADFESMRSPKRGGVSAARSPHSSHCLSVKYGIR